jgi:hypothetical protein
MSFFIFLKNVPDTTGTIYKIAENQFDLNNLNIIQSDYKIIEDSEENFNLVKNNIKFPSFYDNSFIYFVDVFNSYDRNLLETIIESYKNKITEFLQNNPDHPLYNKWNNYFNQLNNFDFDALNYPLDMSLEQYFSMKGLTSLNILQLP